MSEPIELDQRSARCLAAKLIASLLRDAIDGEAISWEMVPEISEGSWDRLVAEVGLAADEAERWSERLDAMTGVNSAQLLKRVS